MQYRHASVVSQTGPDFSAAVPRDGYAWWYVDALSDCGRHGLTMIAMLGCVFSPWYAAARRRGAGDPLAHPALNLALYGDGGRRWALTERGAGDVERSNTDLAIGPSTLHWDGTRLTIEVNEITAPWPSRLRGRVTVHPSMLLSQGYAIDASDRHLWTPISPYCRVEVEFMQPALRWQGTAYLDANEGSAPLEADFDSWNWSRASAADCSRIFYDTRWHPDVATASSLGRSISLAIDAQGDVEELPPPPRQRLAATRWGIARETRCDPGARAAVLETLESGPFYARSLVRTRAEGRDWTAFHESVSLRRFAARWVQALLPVRLPRRPLR
ncbi:MAG: carotenoid 1,2-hydratase [Gammaproteobacteria bacterium]|nr:carotenoid 1,2-hydratase [Gammaproteobacteria bacterium]